MALPSRLRLLRLLRRWRLHGAALLLVVGAAWMAWTLPVREDPAQLLGSQPPAVGVSPLSTAPAVAPELQVWPLDAQGLLQPSPLLRQRFDRLLLNADPEAARATLEQQARTELPPAHHETVLQLWDAYQRLQRHPWQARVDLHRPETWPVALAERQRVRREQLGEAWAQAFFGDEEQRLQAWMAQRSAGRQPPP